MGHGPTHEESFGYVLRWESRLHPGPGQPNLTGSLLPITVLYCRWNPCLRQPKLGSAQDHLGCGPSAGIPPGHDPSTLHPPISHMEIVGARPS